MKEWNGLLLFIDYYIYSNSEEEIIIQDGPNSREALIAYEKGIKAFGVADYDKANLQYYEECKWEYDIALDCVRRLSEEDKNYIRKHLCTIEYHHGYATGIRNRYIYPAKKHIYHLADSISSNVMRKIFSILSPVYDFRDKSITEFFEDVDIQNLLEQYEDRFPEIFESVIKSRSDVHEEEPIDILRAQLSKELGLDEFSRLFQEALLEYQEMNNNSNQEEWYWETNFPCCKAMLYPLQSNQMNVLRRMGLFRQVKNGRIRSISECRTFIDKNLGLRDDYADFMARLAWESYGPG